MKCFPYVRWLLSLNCLLLLSSWLTKDGFCRITFQQVIESAGEGRGGCQEFLPEIQETWITQKSRFLCMIVPPLTVHVTAQAPWAPWNVCLGLGFVGPLHTHRHWWLFYLRWQNFADMNCRSSELDASHSACYNHIIFLWKKPQPNILANHTLKASNATSQSWILHILAKPSFFLWSYQHFCIGWVPVLSLSLK